MHRKYLDVRVLWAVGAVMSLFCAVAIVAVGTIAAVPFLVAVMAGVPQETAIRIFVYASPLWVPIGFGAGTLTASSVVRGIRREDSATQSSDAAH